MTYDEGAVVDLGEQHERVVWREVPLEEVYAVLLQGRYGVLLGRVQRGHHRLRSNLYLIAVHVCKN